MWWMIINTPDDGVHLWELGDRDPAPAIHAAKALLGVPPSTDAMLDGSAWDVQITPGQPHDQLMSRAVIHDPTDLDGADVSAYRAAESAACREGRVRDARQVIDSLDETTRTAVLAAYGRVPASPTKR